MDREIDASAAANIMVCLHHPPVLMKSRWLDSVGLDNREELLQRVAVSGKVRLVVFGHVHQPYDADHDGIRIIGTPSTCRQFKQGSMLFAVDDNPPAYRRIILNDDGSFEGGRLLALVDARVRALARAEGEATVHSSRLCHAVSRMTQGVRYSLICFVP